jgi:hypothetical protein
MLDCYCRNNPGWHLHVPLHVGPCMSYSTYVGASGGSTRDPAAAEQALRDVRALCPDHAEAQRNMAVLHRRTLAPRRESGR